MVEYKHIPVMLEEVLENLSPKSGDFFIDCTLGGGGYSIAIAKRLLPKGEILSIDLDELAIKHVKSKIKDLGLNNIQIVKNNFKNIYEIIEKNRPDKISDVDGIVLDLGLSSAQLADLNRGFSFQNDTPLDMAFDGKNRKETERDTKTIINTWSREELQKILRDYGEERYAGKIADNIVKHRKKTTIKSTGQLIDIIAEVIPAPYRNNRKINFATRTFQALRIATNDELESLKKALAGALELLGPSGKIGVVSYHSLEDRIVKNFFRLEEKECLCPPEIPICRCGHKARLRIFGKKPYKPSLEEVKKNPRARSAKLRIAQKI